MNSIQRRTARGRRHAGRGRSAHRQSSTLIPRLPRLAPCSCRCRNTSSTDAILERIDPGEGRRRSAHPTNLGRLVLNVNGPIHTPAALHPARGDRAAAAQRLRPQGQACRRRRPRRHDRPFDRAAVPTRREHQRDGDPHPHRHDRPAAPPASGRRDGGRRPGVKHIMRAQDVKPGAAVLDVGVTREDDPETGKSKVYGDVAPGRRRGRRLALAEPRRCRPDDRRAPHDQRDRGSRAARLDSASSGRRRIRTMSQESVTLATSSFSCDASPVSLERAACSRCR